VDEIPDEIGEKPVVIKDPFETVIDRVMNSHIILRTLYGTGMPNLRFEGTLKI
jgi:hypothetical protein